MQTKLPQSTIERLCLLFQFCAKLQAEGIARISSTGIGSALGIPAHTIRKDINYLGEVGDTGSGYEVSRLMGHLSEALGFNLPRRACVVGLGRLGSALLEYNRVLPPGFSIEAGFDSSINRLETIRTDIPLYPAYEISDVVRREAIELALLTVPAAAAADVAEDLVKGGIRGIINFTPAVISPSLEEVVVRNMNVVNELRFLSASIALRVSKSV